MSFLTKPAKDKGTAVVNLWFNYHCLVYRLVLQETIELNNKIDILGNKKVDDLELTFLPAAVYAYNVGAITLEKNRSLAFVNAKS